MKRFFIVVVLLLNYPIDILAMDDIVHEFSKFQMENSDVINDSRRVSQLSVPEKTKLDEKINNLREKINGQKKGANEEKLQQLKNIENSLNVMRGKLRGAPQFEELDLFLKSLEESEESGGGREFIRPRSSISFEPYSRSRKEITPDIKIYRIDAEAELKKITKEPASAATIREKVKAFSDNELQAKLSEQKRLLSDMLENYAEKKMEYETISKQMSEIAPKLSGNKTSDEVKRSFATLKQKEEEAKKNLDSAQAKYLEVRYEIDQIQERLKGKRKYPEGVVKDIVSELKTYKTEEARKLESAYTKNVTLVQKDFEKLLKELQKDKKQNAEEIKRLNTIIAAFKKGTLVFQGLDNFEKLNREIEQLKIAEEKESKPDRAARLRKLIEQRNQQMLEMAQNIHQYGYDIGDSLATVNSILEAPHRIGTSLLKHKEEIVAIVLTLGVLTGLTVGGVEIAKANGVKVGYAGSDSNSENLLVAIQKADVNKVSTVLNALRNAGTDINSIVMTDGTTPLILAVNLSSVNPIKLTSYISIIQLLLAYKVDINAADFSGTTALMEAAKDNTSDIVALLLQQGVRLSGGLINLNAQDINGETALMFAVQTGNIDLVNKFLQKNIIERTCLNFNIQNNQGETALAVAKRLGSQPIIDALQRAIATEKPCSPSSSSSSGGTYSPYPSPTSGQTTPTVQPTYPTDMQPGGNASLPPDLAQLLKELGLEGQPSGNTTPTTQSASPSVQ